MTAEQDDKLQAINDKWGVARWTEVSGGDLEVELDDGETGMVEPDGSNTWGV